MSGLPFTRLILADWSLHAGKRWCAEALRVAGGWQVDAPRLVGDGTAFVADLCAGPQPVLAGFDFPIGLPAAYAARAGISHFPAFLDGLDRPEWARFADVCERPEEIALHRPFYPMRPGGAKRAHLVAGLGLDSPDQLHRAGDRGADGLRLACPLFWTLGGNQVGKGALSGWAEVIRPARARGAKIWPHEGRLADLAGVVLAEAYPADAPGHLGLTLKGSKRDRGARMAALAPLADRCERHGIGLSPPAQAMLADGFGADAAGEDRFDAFTGLLSMIEVVEGRLPEGGAASGVEGWILGR